MVSSALTTLSDRRLREPRPGALDKYRTVFKVGRASSLSFSSQTLPALGANCPDEYMGHSVFPRRLASTQKNDRLEACPTLRKMVLVSSKVLFRARRGLELHKPPEEWYLLH